MSLPVKFINICFVKGCTNKSNAEFGIHLISQENSTGELTVEYFEEEQKFEIGFKSDWLCGPCYQMLKEGKIGPSKAWFTHDIRRLNEENLIFRKKLLEFQKEVEIWNGWINR